MNTFCQAVNSRFLCPWPYCECLWSLYARKDLRTTESLRRGNILIGTNKSHQLWDISSHLNLFNQLSINRFLNWATPIFPIHYLSTRFHVDQHISSRKVFAYRISCYLSVIVHSKQKTQCFQFLRNDKFIHPSVRYMFLWIKYIRLAV